LAEGSGNSDKRDFPVPGEPLCVRVAFYGNRVPIQHQGCQHATPERSDLTLVFGNLCQNARKIRRMSTVTMNISLTDDLKAFVDARIKARGFSSASEYMRDLVRRDEERASEERFKALIQAGLDSPLDPCSWEEHRAELSAKIDSARSAPRHTAA
jgi:antitoxin ParD1/3/4